MHYARPFVEVEYDGEIFRDKGCCRYVPIVLRLCGVPKQQHVILTVDFERVRRVTKEGVPLDDYEVRPPWVAPVRTDFPDYYEYALELLVRAHDSETGTIRITMTSPVTHPLSAAIIVFDRREASPIQKVCKGFSGIRLLPSIRTAQERNALQGRSAALTPQREVLAQETRPTPLPSTALHRVSLFPPE